MSTKIKIKWLPAPEDHDYPAASSYLNLIFDCEIVKGIVAKLKRAPVVSFKAKDIFRASGLSLLGVSNAHVLQDRKNIKAKVRLSPLLLVRESSNPRVIIADGYHRLCAVYSFNEDAMIPCKVVNEH